VIEVTIVVCGWCRSPRPLEVKGIDYIPPGAHNALVQVSHGICIPCSTKFEATISKGGTTSDDTSVRNNATEGSKGS
jgi:hypothetical protein